MTDSPVRIANVRRVELGTAARADSDLVAVEEPLLLEIEHGPARARLNAGVILRTPGRDEDLVRGLLHAEGFLGGGRAITRFEHPSPGHIRAHLSGAPLDAQRAGRVLVRATACGLCGRDAIDDLAAIAGAPLPDGHPIQASVLNGLPAALRARQAAFNETGGLHAAAFFDASGACLSSAEDVGRHNAVDKLVGASPASAASPAVLLVSGRAAFEIVHKAVMARVPVLASVGAPTSLAVETARAFNLTLVGFLRDARFNIYSGVDRIV